MSDEMGTFRVAVEIENPERPGERRSLPSVLVDTGAELSWLFRLPVVTVRRRPPDAGPPARRSVGGAGHAPAHRSSESRRKPISLVTVSIS